MTENHRRFCAHLEASEPARWKIARYLSSLGYPVRVPPLRVAPDASQHEDYADDGDVTFEQRAECKHLGVNFTSRHDWPFGEDFIVCEKNSWDRAFPKPVCFFVLSADYACVAKVRASSASRWRVERRRDRRYENVTQEFYFAPLDCVEFVTL